MAAHITLVLSKTDMCPARVFEAYWLANKLRGLIFATVPPPIDLFLRDSVVARLVVGLEGDVVPVWSSFTCPV